MNFNELALNYNGHGRIKQKNQVSFIFFIFFTLTAFILRLLLTRFAIDPYSNLYVGMDFTITVYDYGIAVAMAIIYLCSRFMYRRRINADSESGMYLEATDNIVQGSQTLVFTSSLTGFLLVASSVLMVIDFVSDPLWKNAAVSEHLKDYIENNGFDAALFFIAIFAAIYFFKTASLNPASESTDRGGSERQVSQGYVLFSFFPIIWTFLNIFKCFFDMSKSVNSPIRVYELICFLAISLYFVAESRLLIGRRETGKFFTYAYASMLLTALSALPNLILTAFWILETPTSMIVYAVQISFMMYIAARIYSQIKYGNFSLLKVEQPVKVSINSANPDADGEI